MAPSHYLNQCWLIICEVLWDSHYVTFTWNTQDIYLYLKWDNYLFHITTVSSTNGLTGIRAIMPMNQSWMKHRSVRETKCNVTLCQKSSQTTTAQMKLNETWKVILITKGKTFPSFRADNNWYPPIITNMITVQNKHSPTRKQGFDFPNCDMQGSSKITLHHLAMAMLSNWGQIAD